MPLLVCATPIGNLEDVTYRVVRALGEVDLVLCEDTRRTRVLLERYGIRARLEAYERHREARKTAEVLPLLESGRSVALVSDAGLPGVNDPGARLVAAALEGGHAVSVLPGPSAVETALVASGLVSDRYQFVGYVPRTDPARAALWSELDAYPWPTVAFEAPQRLPRTLASLASADARRPVAVCRELTKRYEEVVRGSAVDLAERFREAPRGELTLVLGPPDHRGGEEHRREAAVAAVAELVAAGAPRRAAAQVVGRLSGVPANDLYAASL